MNNKWFRLDTAGLIFPAVMNNKWSNCFRLSATLKQDIDCEVLQVAVNDLKDRFSSMYVSLHKGLFWNYLESIKGQVTVQMDYAYPLTYMSKSQLKKAGIRVFYYKNRIAVEFFHSITDGTGARIYLCSLVGHYLKLKYGIDFEYNSLVIDPNTKISAEEVEDSFYSNTCDVQASRDKQEAYHLNGEPLDDDFNVLTSAIIPTDILINKAHEYDCTVTAFLCAIMAKSLIEIQNEEVYKKHQKPVKITVPINLRKLYNSKTLRNFVLTIYPGVDPRKGDYSLKELCDSFKHQIAFLATKQNMAAEISSNTVPQEIGLIKIAPLSIKHFVMSLVYNSSAEKSGSITLSNLGNTKLPKQLYDYIDHLEFVIGVQKSYSNNCAVISMNNKTCINMIRTIKESELERLFFTNLVKLNIPVKIDCNRG